MNIIKTVLLLGVLSGLLLFLGEAFGGRQGLYIGLAIAVAMNFFSYFFSDKMALMAYSAQPVTQEQNAGVYMRVAPIVANLAQRMAIPMPKSVLMPDNAQNALPT